METKNTSAPEADPREEDGEDELEESPVPDPEENGDAQDDPEAD